MNKKSITIVPEPIVDALKLPDNLVCMGWSYMHGQLEDDFSYDLFIPVVVPEEYTRPALNWSFIRGDIVESIHAEKYRDHSAIEGCVPVKVIGTDKPCLGFFWIT